MEQIFKKPNVSNLAISTGSRNNDHIYVVVQVQYDFELVQFILNQCNISCTGKSYLELTSTNQFVFFKPVYFSHIRLKPITSDT